MEPDELFFSWAKENDRLADKVFKQSAMGEHVTKVLTRDREISLVTLIASLQAEADEFHTAGETGEARLVAERRGLEAALKHLKEFLPPA
jgi:hypothetical protein